MTINKTLKVKAALVRARSVLTRGERIEKLMSDEKWTEGKSPMGLVKVRVHKLSMKKKKKAAAEDKAESGKGGKKK